jgi:hypothetical protein
VYLVVLVFVLLQSLALGWVLAGGSVLASSIALAVVVVCEWTWEFTMLRGVARDTERIEPRITRNALILVYAACWGVQTTGGSALYLAMRVHTLPTAFELVACHVGVSAVFYGSRLCL